MPDKLPEGFTVAGPWSDLEDPLTTVQFSHRDEPWDQPVIRVTVDNVEIGEIHVDLLRSTVKRLANGLVDWLEHTDGR